MKTKHGLRERWNAMDASHKVFFLMFLAFVIVAIGMLIGHYTGVEQMPSPSGEGG
jgi:hypothetical protein